MKRRGNIELSVGQRGSQRAAVAVLLMTFALPACGGGGGDDSNPSGGAGGGGGNVPTDGGSVPLECTSSGAQAEMVSVPAGA
ncbi:MAG TPA: hypothetical protein VI072_22025, partial [Polyangiaceae bacterium]